MKLEGKVAIVTGSGRGIGEAIAKKFAYEGALVVLNARHPEGINQIVKEIIEQGGKATAIVADVSQKCKVDDMVNRTIETFGAIHILVNNAAIIRYIPTLKTTAEDWNAIHDVNLKGTFFCIQAVLPQMIEQKYGKIINVSSIAALGVDSPNVVAYSAAKGGVISLTKFIAREIGPYGINVNCIMPGRTVTDMLYVDRSKEEAEKFLANGIKHSVLGRIGKPHDIANLALFLATGDSDFMSWQVIRIDGGRSDLM